MNLKRSNDGRNAISTLKCDSRKHRVAAWRWQGIIVLMSRLFLMPNIAKMLNYFLKSCLRQTARCSCSYDK